MGCGGCRGIVTTSSFTTKAPEFLPDINLPEGFQGELRGHDAEGKSTKEPCKFRYSTLMMQKDGTYTDMIICQNKECPLFNIMTCPCDCDGCPWRKEKGEESDGETDQGPS